jgi:hypothetical protein
VETAQNGCSDTVFIDVNVVTSTSIEEQTTNKRLLKVTDILGRETKGTKNKVTNIVLTHWDFNFSFNPLYAIVIFSCSHYFFP